MEEALFLFGMLLSGPNGINLDTRALSLPEESGPPREGSAPRTQEVYQNSRLLDTFPARGELACRECSDHWDSGESWTPRSAERG